MACVEQSVHLRQPPEVVWNFVVRPENFPRYVAGYHDGVVLGDLREGPGLRFRWRTRFLGLGISSTEEVAHWDPPRRIGFVGTMAGVRFRSAMVLQPERSGTRFTVRIEYESPLPVVGGVVDAWLLRPIIARQVAESLRNLERWDRAANSQHGPAA